MLNNQKLKKVVQASWSIEPNISQEGFKKVQEIEGYSGVFRDSEGKLYDLRPKENIPTRENLRKKSREELVIILRKALEGQIAELKKIQYNDKHYEIVASETKKKLEKLNGIYADKN